MGGLPICKMYKDIQTHSGSCVVMIGLYHQIDIRMKPKPPMRFAGHAALRLEDGTEVLLEPSWSAVAIRSHQEISQYDGYRVAVSGRAWAQSPAPPQPAAYMTNACLSPVESIMFVAGSV